jgi:NAD(P) transhydrogenase subunit alpha
MKIGIPAETRPGETRVAATPETVKKLIAAKHHVVVQSGAGVAASITDEAYAAAGAEIVSADQALGADLGITIMTTLKLPGLTVSGSDDVTSLNLFKSGGRHHGMLPSLPIPPTWSKATTRCS